MDDQDNTPWQYKPDDGAPAPDLPDDDIAGPSKSSKRESKSLAWQAPEFIEHHHPASWYSALAVVSVVLAGLVYLLTKDYFATVTIVILGGLVGVFAGHKPGLAQYEINSSGLSVNGKAYPHSSFKSFAVLQEGTLSSINLLPLKRFVPPVAAYFEPADEQKIIDVLGDFLPMEERQMDGIDRLSRRLRL